MNFTDTDIILFAVGVGLLILLITGYVLLSTLSGPRKKTLHKLDVYKSKFSNTPTVRDKSKSIRVKSEEEGLAALLSSLVPNREVITKRLIKTGKNISLSQYAIAMGVLIVLTFVVLMLIMDINVFLSLAASIIIGAGLPHMIIGNMAKKRMEAFTSQFPEALDLMVRGLKSGLPVNETIVSVGQEVAAPTGDEFRKIADAMRFGATLEDALWETSNRLDTPDFKFFVISLVVQRETGGNLGETLGNLASILRSRQAMKLKIAALSSEAKASAWIVGLLPFIMAGILLMLNYDYAIVLYTEPRAQTAGIIALMWMSLGVFIMSRMIDFEV